MNRFDHPFLCFISLLVITGFRFSGAAAADALTPAQSLRDGGGDTIVSAAQVFELGFFSPGGSTRRYLGIWYKKISPLTVVWVANRETPLLDSSGALNLTDHGNLILLDRTTQGIIWSSNTTSSVSRSPVVAQLLDSGNFVVRETNSENPEENPLWQSFEHPGNTLLPGMKLGMISDQSCLQSWKSADDPSPGDSRYGVDPDRFRQVILTQNSSVIFRSGLWNGKGFSGVDELMLATILKFHFVSNQKETYCSFEVTNASIIARVVLNQGGQLRCYIWEDRRQNWILYRTSLSGTCSRYAPCGPFGGCSSNLQTCVCLEGFQPMSPKLWSLGDWRSGCVRNTPLKCGGRGGGEDGFRKISRAKLPDTANYWFRENMSLDECRLRCVNNCSCLAYANPYKTGQLGCLLWFSDLIDSKDTNDNADSFYVRVAASELEEGDGRGGKSNEKKRVKIIGGSVGVATATLLLVLGGLVVALNGRRNRMQRQNNNEAVGCILGSEKTRRQENLELPLFDLATIKKATENFSLHNKLGEGGFGPVYKGVLTNGQEVAVKRLSRSSKQGLDEFKNEVMHIAKLQHRNLVKLLGCYFKGEEKILVYEYMPNKSLDFHIFDKTKSTMLDWPTRSCIVNGVARGLMYLHQDSRLRIIHRDLKAANVLLDNEMNPRISDFGLARSFIGNKEKENTKRVVGTYGYMSPEYATDGTYSTKSDVFSFGVLTLEIVSGKRNRGFIHPDHSLNLLGHAWQLHKESKALELVDAAIDTTSNPSNSVEMARSIHIGLLCVQRNPENRPSMSRVVQMLDGDGTLLPPKQPGFFIERDLDEGRSSSSNKHALISVNEMSATTLAPR